MSADQFFGEDDPILDPEVDLLTAEASAVDGFPEGDTTDDDERALGRTWVFDWTRQRFHRTGLAPTETRDEAALGVWIETTLRVGRLTYGIFSDDYGIDEVDAPIGEIITPTKISDLARRITEAILVHDRVTAVENIILEAADDAIILRNMEVVVDDTNRLSVTDSIVT